ncbi:hypothetical protein WNY78_06130 [Psychroserpens sp. AS72]|uniref:hypothetical protein n=1 Tax=Psychroserpens sp. AS72 TaxID=3135775 RepID=UPI0031803219
MNFLTQSNNNTYETTVDLGASHTFAILAGVVSYLIAALIGILLLIIMFKLIKYLNLKIKLMSRELKNE